MIVPGLLNTLRVQSSLTHVASVAHFLGVGCHGVRSRFSWPAFSPSNAYLLVGVAREIAVATVRHSASDLNPSMVAHCAGLAAMAIKSVHVIA